MSNQVSLSFIKDFEAEVYLQYQQMGSKLRNTVRTKDNIVGLTTTFHQVGKDAYEPPVECILQDYFAGDWVDRIDELKTNINEQKVVSKASAYSLGRKTDELVIDAMVRSLNIAGDVEEGLPRDKISAAFEMLTDDDVPDDGQRFAVVGWRQWSDLLNIQEFANAEYIDNDQLPWKGTQAKRWLGTLWIPHSGLPKAGNVRQCFWYHKTAIGHAVGSGVKTDITWHGDRAAHFINNMMSQGACLIDSSGVVAMRCLES